MKHPIASRRAQLLARSALCGVLGAMAIGASSAMAQVTGVGTVNTTTSNGANPGVVSGGGVTDITMGAGSTRSIINWANLTVTPTEALNFYFNNRSDIVVNRVAGAASIDGILNGCMATCAVNGGNIWVLSTNGILIGANAQINTGGFLASTGSLTDADILDGDMNFAFTAAPANSTISVAGGASLNTNGGSLALIAPIVTTDAGSTITATNGGDVIYGSAENYNVTFAPTAGNDLDLLTFQVPAETDGSSGTPGLTLNGTTTANQVFAAIVSKSGVASSILLGGNITATTASGENGDIVLSAGSGFTNGVADAPMGFDASITQNTTATLTGVNVTMRASDGIVADEINATGQVRLESIRSSITQTGAITAGLLTASAGSSITLGQANAVATLGDLTAGGTGDITFVNSGDLDLTGDITSGSSGVVTITSTGGAIDQSAGAITADWLRLNAATTITQGSGATFTSFALSLASGGNVSLGEENNFNRIFDLAVGGDLTLRNSGSIDMGPLLSGFYNAAGALNLTSDTGSIFTTGAGVVTSRLTASAAGSITLDGTIGSLGDVTAGGNILLNNYSTALDLTGDVTGQTVSLYAGGGVTQSGGKIDATRINVITNGAISLTGANEIDVVGRLSTDPSFSGTGANITLRNVGSIVLDYLVEAAGATVLFTSDTGGISQTGFSAITAGTLTASAAGNITLYDGGNDITTIGGLASTNGDIVYRDVNGFDIQGDITANSTNRGLMLVAGGAGGITQTSGVLDVGYFRGIAQSGITLGGANLIRRLISTQISNGALTLNSTTDLSVDGTVSANTVSLTTTGAITQATNAQIWTTTLNAGAVTGINLTASGFGANNIGNLGVITNTTSGGIVVGNSNPTMNLTGTITAAGQAVLISNTMGGINQTGGIITAGSLSLSAAGGISATRNNVFGSLGAVTAAGDVAIVNVGDLTLTDNVNTGGGDLSLTSTTGEIDQTGGVITAGTLNASGVGGVDLDRANLISALGVINAGSGAFTFQNVGGFQLNAAVTAASVDLTSNTGAITSGASGTITATDLTVSAVTGIDLSNAGNSVANLAGLVNSASGDLVYGQTGGFQITGAVMAINGGMSLSSLSGSITQTASGIITTDYLNAGAGDDLILDQANVVGGVGNLLAGGGAGDDLVFNSTLGFNINGLVGGDDVTLTSGGAISQGATSRLVANLLTLDAVGGVNLPNFAVGTGNDIDALGLVTAGGAVSIGSVSVLDLTADIETNGANLSLFSQLGLTQSGGVLRVNTLSAQVATGGIMLNRANEVAALGNISAGNVGDFTFRNTGDIILNGVVQAAGDDIFLTSDTGAVVQNGAGMSAARLSVSAQTGINLDRANLIGALTALTTTTGDITFRNTGSIVAPALTTPGRLTLISNFGSVSQTGAFNAASLVVSGQTGVALHTQVNDVDTILGLTSVAGDILYRDGDGFDLAGNVTSADIVSLLNDAGSITQSAGIITTNLLTATSADNITLNRGNQVSLIGSLIAGGDITFVSTLDLAVLNEITGDDVSITSGGSFTQDNDGDITASSLTVGAATGISLTNAGNNVSTVAGLINTGSGDIAFSQTNGYQISGAVSALGQTVSLSSVNGAIAQNAGSISAGTLNASAAGTLWLNQGNDVTSLGVISTGGSFLFRDVNGFALTDNVTVASQLIMLAQNGSINQTGGTITAADINAMASVDILLGGANQIGAISALSAGRDILYRQVGNLSVPAISANGSLSLYSTTGSISQTGVLSAATLNLGALGTITLTELNNTFGALGNLSSGSGSIYVYEADGFDLTGAITTSNAGIVNLAVVSGAITQQAGATIEAGGLELFAAGGATLDGDNDIDVLTGVITTGASFTFNDVDGFDLFGNIEAQTANLTSGGAITQGTGVLNVGTLSLSAASATLNGANDIDNLGDVNVTGDMSFRDIGDINLNGNQTVGGTLSLTSGAIIRQLGSGVLDAGRFEANAVGGVLIGNSGNAVASLGDISTTSGAIYITTTSPLTIDGDLTAAGAGGAVTVRFGGGGVAMTNSASITTGGNVEIIGAGDIVLGAITADRLWTISHSGTISSTAAPTIVANRLTGSAAGSFVLTGSNIDINEFAFNAANEISLTGNNGPLDLIGQVAAQTVTLGSTGAITQSAGLVRAAVATLSGGSIVANQANDVQTVNLNGASIAYTNAGSFAANVVTSTGAVSLTSNTGKITQTASTGRIVADSLTASAATGLEFFGGQNDIRVLAGLSSTGGDVTWRDMGGFEITGDIDAAGQTVELVSDGTGADGNDVVQTSGVITANRLQGTSAGDLLFHNANLVAQLGSLNAGGDIRYRGAASFTLQDNVNAGGELILNSDTGSIQQFGGAIVADAFSGTAAQGISLSRVNDVDALGAVDSGAGDFNFRDLDSFDIAGLITSDTSIMLQAGGNISQSSGSIVTGTLSLFAGATAVIAGPGNDIDFLGLSTGMAALAFTDVDGFGINDRVFSGGAISLTATTGDIVEVAGGYLSANGLSVYASNGEIDLAGDNIIENVGDLMAGGDLTFHDTDGFLTFGNIAGDAVRLTTAAGGISQINGAIGANSLYASALTGLNLTSIGNDVDFITGLVNLTSGGISYHNANSVSITGAVTAIGQTVNFDVNGNLSQTGAGVISAGRVQGAAMGAFALADAANEIEELGPISANSISLVTVDTGLTIVGALYATQGVDLKADDFITQTAAGTITGQTLRAQADGDIILGEANDLDSITLLYSDLGDVTYNDIDGFSLDASSYGDFWSSGTFTLTAGGTGDITQSGAGLRAGTLLVTAGGDIMLDQDNRIDVLGASSAGGSVFRVINLGDLDLAGDISVAHPLGALVLISNTGKVEQTSGEIDAYTVGGSSAGDFVLTNFTGALGDISTMVGDIDVSNAGDIVLFGGLLTDNAHSVTLTSTGGSITHGVGRIETGTLNLDAAIAIALDGAQSNDVERLGTVRTYSNFAFRNDDSFELSGDIDVTMTGGGVVLTADSGGVTQTGGAITASGLALQTMGGIDLSGANMVDRLTVNNGSTANVAFINAKALNVLGVTSSGGVALETTAGLLTVSGGVTTDGEINLAGAGGVLATGSIGTIGDITVTAATGDIELYDVTVGDDLAVTAIDGDAQVRNLTLTGSSDGEADGGNAWIYASGDAFLGARDEAGIGSHTVNRAGGVGEIVVASTGDGDAGVFLQNANTQIDLSAGADGTATYVLATGDLQAGNVSGTNVVLKANDGAVNADLVILGGGDYTLQGQDFSVGAFGFIGAARDITINDTLGDLTVTADVAAQRNMTITASGAVIDGTGATSLIAGAGGAGDLSITAEGIEAAVVGAAGNVTLAAGAGAVDIDTLVVAGDYTLSGSSFSTGALSPIGATAGTWSITDTDDFDFTGLMLTYNGGINIQAGDLITGGSVQSINGSVTINGPADIDIEGLYAATDITVDSANDLTIGSADAYGGGITLTGRSVTVEGYADASGAVLVAAANGTADVHSAAAGGDITVNATNGDARLGAARFTGVTGDLSLAAISGRAILGAWDYSTISSDNFLDRAAGHTGTATITAVDGDALVYLDSLAGPIDLVRGDTVDLMVESGDAAFGQLDAVDGDIHVETLDGALTIGDATTTTGGVGLYAAGGGLTLTGGVYGADGVVMQTDGLLDGRLATQIATGGDLQLTGGSVLVNRLQADRDVLVAATDGDASVEFAEAGGGVFVGSLTGAATLRGAVAVDGITMIAEGDVTFGAADRSLITGDNYGSVTGGCGCGGGIYLQSLNGDARVNLLYADSAFDMIAAGPAGDVDVVLLTGDLTVGELAGFNITAEVSGSIETLVGAFIGGGNYSLTATDFLGNVLSPDQVFGTMGDYTIVDLGGGLDMTGVAVAVQGDIRIDVRGNGALTGDARLTADGDVAITAAAIAADTLDAGRDLALTASAGVVNVATRVTVGRDYALRGTDFSAAALSPLGARVGNLDIDDTAGDLDYSAETLGYGGNIGIRAAGLIVGGDITSADGDIVIEAGGGMVTGALSAANGRIDAYGYGPAGVTVASATAGDSIDIYTSGGDAVLGAAALLGAGANTLRVQVDGGSGNAVLGSALAANITAANAFTSMGSSTTAVVSSTGGDAFVNLDASDALTSVSAAQNAAVVVRNGGLTVDSIDAGAGRIDVDTGAGAFAAGRLTAATDAGIRGGDVTLTDADIGGDLTVNAGGGIDLAGPGGGRSGRVVAGGEISLTAGGGVSQHADASLVADGLTLDAGGAVSLLGANQIDVLRAIDVANGGFAYRSVRSGGLDLAGAINAAGQTVDLRVENGGLSQSGGAIVAGRLTGVSDGGVWLAGGNLIGELGDFVNAGGAFFLNVDQALNIVGTVDSASALRIQSDAMTIAATGTVRSTAVGDAVLLASNGVFTNNSGADGVEAANGRWLIYSQAAGNPGGPTAGNDFGGLGGRSYYGSTYDFGTGGFSAAPNAGNRFVYAYQPTLTVTPINQRVTYNGQIPTLGALIAGLINGDAAADAWSGAPTFSGAASKNVGTYGVSAALGSLLSDMNYAFSFGSGTLIIDPKALTGTVTATNKTYDGSTDATGSIGLNGVVAGDAVVATATGFRFADRNAGLGRIVAALGAALSGSDAGNYTLGSVGTGVADILRRSLTGVLTANNKTYDGTAAATGSIGLTGVVAGDEVSASGNFSFADRNAGAGKIVNASGLVLSGADAANYDLGPISGVADILRRAIGGTVVADDKTYDGSTAATGTINLTGVVGADDIRAGGTLTFSDRNAGVGRTVSAAGAALSGADAGNYTLTGVANGIADILRRAISITAHNQSKRWGQGDPSLTYVVGGGGLVAGDLLTGGLVRTGGEVAGVYVIGQGDLAASSNYILTFMPGEFVIQIPPAGGVQSLQMLRNLGEAPAFALDRDPSPGLIVDNGEDDDAQDPRDQAGVRSTSN